MKRTTLRAAGVSVAAAIALGIAAPAANATTATPARTVASAPAGAYSIHQSTPATGTTDVTPSVSVKAVWEAIKRAGFAKKAWEAAKKGRAAFMNWVDSLSNWNPLKWTIKAMPTYMINELITYIINNY
ncbi:hypothetical protein [Streptomyces tsukubensis]|uniref:hypothetical protein n=1 Tax=Streptomyces tsukubensis TaxID=83656 RepID=UPI00344C2B93